MNDVEPFPGQVPLAGMGTIPREDLASYGGLELLQRIVDGKYPVPSMAALLSLSLVEVLAVSEDRLKDRNGKLLAFGTETCAIFPVANLAGR